MSAIQRAILSTAVGTALVLFAFGCGEQPDAPTPPKPAERARAAPSAKPPAPPPAPPAAAKAPDTPSGNSAAVKADAKAGKADYQIYCASCHGETGAGDGPVAPAIPPPAPRDFTVGDFKYDADEDGTTGTDADLKAVIAKGAGAFGGNPMMAPLGLSDQQIHNVIAFIRTLAEPPNQP